MSLPSVDNNINQTLHSEDEESVETVDSDNKMSVPSSVDIRQIEYSEDEESIETIDADEVSLMSETSPDTSLDVSSEEEKEKDIETETKREEIRVAQKLNTANTTFGERVEPHDITIMREALELSEMGNAIKLFLNSNYWDQPILVAHFNYYCAEQIGNPKYLIPSEFAIIPFSLNSGIALDDALYGFIDINEVPRGLRSEAMEMAKHTNVPMIERMRSLYGTGAKVFLPTEASADIDAFVSEFGLKVKGKQCIFVTREQIPIVDRCLKYLKSQCSHVEEGIEFIEDHNYQFLPLALLVLHLGLRTSVCLQQTPAFASEGIAERLIEYPKFSYCHELACEFHGKPENRDSVDKCSKTIVSRMIYNVLQYFAYQQKASAVAPTHAPKLEVEDVVDRVAKEQIEKEIRNNGNQNHDGKPERRNRVYEKGENRRHGNIIRAPRERGNEAWNLKKTTERQ